VDLKTKLHRAQLQILWLEAGGDSAGWDLAAVPLMEHSSIDDNGDLIAPPNLIQDLSDRYPFIRDALPQAAPQNPRIDRELGWQKVTAVRERRFSTGADS